MTVQEILRLPGARAAGGALAVATLIAAWSLVRAVRVEPVSAATTTAPPALRLPPRLDVLPPDPSLVAEANIFASDRTGWPERYPMPGDAPAEPDAEPAPEPPKPVVLGTAIVGAGGNFATVQLGSGRPTSVRVGDKVGIYTVTRIERGKVLFTSQSGERLEVSAAKQGS